MWKSLAAAVILVLVVLGSGQAHAVPTQYAILLKETASGTTLVAHRGYPAWRRYPRYHGQYRPHSNFNRHYYPYYRRYYRPNWAWNYCGWGFGYWPNGCFGRGYYGGYLEGYYGDSYFDREYDQRRERVSHKKHVKWCKARYKTYNVKTDTFIGKGKRKYRCNSPYDGRR